MAYLALSPAPKAAPSSSAGHKSSVSNSAVKPTSAKAQHNSSGTSVEMSPADRETPGSVAKASAASAPMRASYKRRPSQNTASAVAVCSSGEGRRTHASSGPHAVVAAPMIQAMSGGLEKYPSAGSWLHAQYCASSKNRSVPFTESANSRTHNNAARPARRTDNQLTSRPLVPEPVETDMARALCKCAHCKDRMLQGESRPLRPRCGVIY